MERYDVIILGGGISGISCCSILQANGVNCILVEKEASLGGLTRSRQVNGFVFDCHGGHIFNTSNERVREWVFSYLPKEQWSHSPRKAKIWYGNKFVSYPFELALGELPPREATECIMGLIGKNGREPKSLDKWLPWNFGEPIAKKYLIPYNKKIWKRELSKISSHWVRGKMPLPNLRDVIYAALSKDASENMMIHSTYYYPKSGGIESLISRVVKRVRNVALGSSLNSLERNRGDWIVNGSFTAKKLISTIPIPELARGIRNIPIKIERAISRLDWNTITTVMCEQKKGEQLSWLYLPDKSLSAHRIVYQGHLARNNCPPGKFSATYEITGKHSPKAVIRPFRNPVFPAELRALDILDFEHTEYAYPVYHMKFLKDIEIIQSWLGSIGVISCGRFAEWKYLNMDDCIRRAFEVTDTLLQDLSL